MLVLMLMLPSALQPLPSPIRVECGETGKIGSALFY